MISNKSFELDKREIDAIKYCVESNSIDCYERKVLFEKLNNWNTLDEYISDNEQKVISLAIKHTKTIVDKDTYILRNNILGHLSIENYLMHLTLSIQIETLNERLEQLKN